MCDRTDKVGCSVGYIATSMDKETLHKAHPGYVEIIKDLSYDEASLLKAFFSFVGLIPQLSWFSARSAVRSLR